MTSVLALLLDSYRDLNSRKLFWITLGLSGFVVLIFLGLGITPQGMTFFGMTIHTARLNSELIDPAYFYKAIFVSLGVNVWLTFVAAILALICTGGMFPDLLAGGSIELYLSKPVTRLKLFVTKYFAGMLFATLQVLVFSFASFIVLRIRAGIWAPGVFLAVPTVILYFSYLFCICVYVGVSTRSTVASILFTLLFMFIVWGVHMAEADVMLVAQKKNQIVSERVAHLRRPDPAQAKKLDEEAQWLSVWHGRALMLEAILPKNQETVDLMQRWLMSAADFRDDGDLGQDSGDDGPGLFNWTRSDAERAKLRAVKELHARSLWWVLGTSLTFEAVIVTLSAVRFCRRDY